MFSYCPFYLAITVTALAQNAHNFSIQLVRGTSTLRDSCHCVCQSSRVNVTVEGGVNASLYLAHIDERMKLAKLGCECVEYEQNTTYDKEFDSVGSESQLCIVSCT